MSIREFKPIHRMSAMTRPTARVCQECGKPMAVFAFVLSGKPGYWHRRCFAVAKKRNA